MIKKRHLKKLFALLALCAVPLQGTFAETATENGLSEGDVPRARAGEIVVTGTRDEVPRKESPVIVSTVSSEELSEITGSTTVAEGLNFATGLRMENGCQNCGFNQLRMNGLEGPYSQILIDSRAIFSAVAGVYGLELIPTNMIDRIEVVRGAGSALYGSNAIGGTVNLILKDPLVNSYEFDASYGSVGVGESEFGDAADDYTAKVNASVVSDDSRMGMTIFGFYRDREPFDANDDGFSEIAKLNNTTLGLRAFKRVGDRGKLTADVFTINEDRRGGDRFDEIEHQANIAESIKHEIISGALTFTQGFRDYDKLMLYVAAQNVDRATYYGAEQDLSAYGQTDNLSLQIGGQYKAVTGPSEFIFGVENNFETLEDSKLAYLDIEEEPPVEVPGFMITDQESNILGVFGQYQYTYEAFKATVGVRWDNYEITNAIDPGADVEDDILLPRATLLYSFTDDLQFRMSYGQGYRAPQVFNEDLHIETSGARRVTYENEAGLKTETSDTYMASLDFDTYQDGVSYGLLVEGFYTKLDDPFFVDFGEADEDGNVLATRRNADGAVVQGVNIEGFIAPSEKFAFKGGVTIQSSKYDEPQDFDEEKFFRTPDTYGFMTVDWEPADKVGISLSGTYTGEMLIPYYGTDLPEGPIRDAGELRESDSFFDLGVKVRYTVPVDDAGLQFYAGVKNIFNSYQDDFDSTIDRDPGYVYGPMSPRTFYLGVKLGNLL